MDGAAAGYGKPINRSYCGQYEFTSQFEGAERIATKYGITRDDTDAFGLESQVRARRAVAEGRFETPDRDDRGDARSTRTASGPSARKPCSRDEVPRETSLEALAALKPVARADGIHTAGTSAPRSPTAPRPCCVMTGRAGG